jgi:hypothetical protein
MPLRSFPGLAAALHVPGIGRLRKDAAGHREDDVPAVERGRIEAARDTISKIAGLIDRKASISRHLRNFARKPNQKLGSVPCQAPGAIVKPDIVCGIQRL